MDAHLHEWANLLIRWLHITVGIAWIGASFYFNWLENQLERRSNDPDGVAGELWAIHGGGFYHLRKYEVAPPRLPETLHWFKWEAYWTWISGTALLVVVYYFNARTMMVNPDAAALGPGAAIAVGVATLLGSWFVYDGLCRSPLAARPGWLAAVLFALLVALAWGLSELLSGRAAYIHVGAAIGTCMVANVFRVIIPGQRAMVQAMEAGRAPDPEPGKRGLQRSRHNNYLTLPVLFIMISNHFPSTYGHPQGWLVLIAVSAAGVAIRHYFNQRHKPGPPRWLMPAGIAGLLAVAVLSAPQLAAYFQERGPTGGEPVRFAAVRTIVDQRCAVCHAREPRQPGFTSPPLGVRLDSAEAVRAHRQDIARVAVHTRTMPPGNLTGLTEAERETLARWTAQEQE